MRRKQCCPCMSCLTCANPSSGHFSRTSLNTSLAAVGWFIRRKVTPIWFLRLMSSGNLCSNLCWTLTALPINPAVRISPKSNFVKKNVTSPGSNFISTTRKTVTKVSFHKNSININNNKGNTENKRGKTTPLPNKPLNLILSMHFSAASRRSGKGTWSGCSSAISMTLRYVAIACSSRELERSTSARRSRLQARP